LREHGKKTGRMPYIVADEPYREIAYNNAHVPPILNAYAETIVVNSYSKCLSLPGERIGYIAVSPNIADKDDVINAFVYAMRTLGYVSAPALMQLVVAELTEVSVDANIYMRRRDALMAALDAAGIEYIVPEGAFYLFCKVPSKKVPVPAENRGAGDDMAFVNHLKDHLILGVPGSTFGTSGWLRLAYCVSEENIRASAGAFKKAMKDW